MKRPPALLDLGAARRIAREWMGKRMILTACWQPPEGIFRLDSDDANTFYFLAMERGGWPHLGASRYAAVDRRTGEVTEFRAGE